MADQIPTSAAQEQTTHDSPLWALIKSSGLYKKDVILGSLYSFLNKLFDIAPEILIGIAIDLVIKKEASFLARWGLVSFQGQLLTLALLTFVIWSGESIFEYLYKLKWRGLAQKVQHDLRIKAYGRIQQVDSLYSAFHSTGNVVSVINDDINQLERFLDQGANGIIQVIASTLLITGVFLYLSPQIAFWALAPIPVIIIGTFHFQRLLEPLYKNVRVQAAAISTRLTTNVIGLETIKAQAAEAYEEAKVEELSLNYCAANQAAIKVSSLFTPLIRMAILAGFVATLVNGGLMTYEQKISVGTFGILVFLTQRLLWPLTSIADITDLYQRARASTARVLELLAATGLPSSTGSHKNVLSTPPEDLVRDRQFLRGDLIFSQVHFSYPSRPQKVLEQLNLHIPAQKTIGIVGTTGSGKSTIVRLLLRLLEPTQGEITIGGRRLQDISPKTLRQGIGLVAQDVFLVDGTVLDNIRYGHFQASEDQVIAAAMIADAHVFIEKLPQGYHTPIGERGYALSGGQRQRLAIARALIKDPPILILDEATSSVDTQSERSIQKAIETMSHQRTVLVIAHRLSTLKNVDSIFVLGSGRVLESGTHEELLEIKGAYHRLWTSDGREVS